MYGHIKALMDALSDAGDFETAAAALLRGIRAFWSQTIVDNEAGISALSLGVVHLPAAGAVERTAAVDFGARPAADAGSGNVEPPDVSPANWWRWIHEYRSPVMLDVDRAELVTRGGGVRRVDLDADGGDAQPPMPLRRSGAAATNEVLLLPVVGTDADVAGVVALAFQVPSGRAFGPLSSDSIERIRLLVEVASARLLALPGSLSEPICPDRFLPVVGPTMAPLLDRLSRFAASQETLLLSGPTGTGKSRLARWCHSRSSRSDGPFVALDLMGVPESMQLARLMGWKRGAFTGAHADVDGAVSRAQGGTLFIDEIANLSSEAQAGLLQLFEERTYHVLGDSRDRRRADVRLIVGTNVDLAAAVERGQFRQDLYYRIDVLPFRVPSLDERRDALGDWAGFMLERCACDDARGPWRFSAPALEVLSRMDWPGNLRQLDNVVRRCFVLARAESAEPLIRRRHVLDAVEVAGRAASTRVAHHLELGARAFVDLAEQYRHRGEQLDWELTDAFSGYVLRQAVESCITKAEAFRLLGRPRLVEHNNHFRRYNRGMEAIEALRRAERHPAEPLSRRIAPEYSERI